MTKKTSNKSNSPAAAVKRAKGKAQPAEQTKIPGTGRLDAIAAVEDAAKDLQSKAALREQAEVAEDEANEALTQALIEHKLGEYVYEGKDGVPYCAYVPKARKPKARIRKIKRKKPDMGDGE